MKKRRYFRGDEEVFKNAEAYKNFLIILTVIVVISILALLINSIFKSSQTSICNVKEPFNCKDVKIYDQNAIQSYIILNSIDVKSLRVIPESFNVDECSSGYVDSNGFLGANKESVKIILSCNSGGKGELINGKFDLLYMLNNGDVRKTTLDFSTKRSGS